jgi:CTP:molybdopterin cytidylyltransferase MocA
MGRHKLLLPLGGLPLVAHAVAAACASGADPVLVVVGHQADQVHAAVLSACPQERLRFMTSDEFASGMSSSLRVGIAAVPAMCAGALVLLGDQPLLGPALAQRLLDAARAHPHKIIAATYAGQRGNPVYFSREYFAELAAVTGDEGGRSVVERHRDQTELVECGDLAVPLDVDDPADYARAQALWAERNGPTASLRRPQAAG